MKVYEFGNKSNPVILLLPGTCCHWKLNFDNVIDKLSNRFLVSCISYDGFDETQKNTEFTTILDQISKIEQYIKENYNNKIHAIYGCSLGGSLVGLLISRKNVNIKYGIIGSSDFDQAGKISAKLQTKIITSVIYPLLHYGHFKSKFMQNFMDKRISANGEYGKSFMKLFISDNIDLSFVTKHSIANQFYSDLITPLPNGISCNETEVHILYAQKMGEKYLERYNQHFKNPIVHTLDMKHEELLVLYPNDWVDLITKICF